MGQLPWNLLRLAAVVLVLPACGGESGGGLILPSPVPGAFDPAFDSDGVIIGANGFAQDLTIDALWMYLVGNESVGGGRWRIEKRALSDGAFDPGFGPGGVATSDPTGGLDIANAVALSGGSLFIAGFQNYGGPGDSAWRIEKRSASTGALDGVFGGGTGVVVVTPASGSSIPMGVAVSGTDLFIVGFQYPAASADYQWRIEKRSATTGALDGVFASGTGLLQLDFGTGQDEAHSIVLDATSLYVAGLSHVGGPVGDYAWRVEKRDRTTGALDGVFGSGTGAITSNPSTNSYDDPRAIALSGSSLYIAGFHDIPGVTTERVWRLEKRDAATGALDPVFGGGSGFIESNPGTLNDQVSSVVVDGASVYIGGWFDTTALSDSAWRVEKRSSVTGALDNSFGTAGAVVSDPYTLDDMLQGLAVDGTSVYTTGRQRDLGGYHWRIEKRAK